VRHTSRPFTGIGCGRHRKRRPQPSNRVRRALMPSEITLRSDVVRGTLSASGCENLSMTLSNCLQNLSYPKGPIRPREGHPDAAFPLATREHAAREWFNADVTRIVVYSLARRHDDTTTRRRRRHDGGEIPCEGLGSIADRPFHLKLSPVFRPPQITRGSWSCRSGTGSDQWRSVAGHS